MRLRVIEIACSRRGVLNPVPMTRLMWKWEDEDDDGEGIGPWWVVDGDDEEGETWVRRSEAERIARERGYDFAADE